MAQSSYTDSLQIVINKPGVQEKSKPALLNRLAEAYRISRDYVSAEKKARQSAHIAIHYKDYAEAAKAYTLLTIIKANNQQLKTLKQTSDSALILGQQSKNHVAMAYGYYAQAFLYKTLEDPEKRIKFCQLGLKELEKSPDPGIAAKFYYQLYAANSDWNNIAKVNSYARKATENALKTKDYNLLSNCYTALSVAHEYNYNESKETQELDSVLFYLQKAENLYTQYPKHVAKYTQAITRINISSMYLKYYPAGDPTAESKAVYYARSAANLLKNVPNTQEVTASSIGILSELASRKGNTVLAETYLMQAYDLMKTGEHPYYYTLINVVQSLSAFYKRQGDFKKAF